MQSGCTIVEQGNKLGQGGFGTVYAVTLSDDGRKGAMKIANSPACRADLKREQAMLEIVTKNGHPHLIHLLNVDSVSLASYAAAFVMEYATMGDLFDAIVARVKQHNPFPLSIKLSLMYQIASGLQALHGLEIVHRDLKTENILLTDNGNGEMQAKITDFGLSAFYLAGQTPPLGHFVGSVNWVAPDAFMPDKSQKQQDFKSDIYSLCVVFLAIYFDLAGGLYSDKKNNNEIIKLINTGARVAGYIQALQNDNVPADIISIVKSGLMMDPAKRPAAKAITTCLQTFFTNENKKNLIKQYDDEKRLERECRVMPIFTLIENSLNSVKTKHRELSAFQGKLKEAQEDIEDVSKLRILLHEMIKYYSEKYVEHEKNHKADGRLTTAVGTILNDLNDNPSYKATLKAVYGIDITTSFNASYTDIKLQQSMAVGDIALPRPHKRS